MFITFDLLAILISQSCWREGGGKYCTLNSFHDNQVTIRRPERTILSFSISPIPGLLLALTSKNKWNQATQLCRNVKVSLWLLIEPWFL